MNKNGYIKNEYLRIFLMGFVCAFCIFLPFLVIDLGFFTYAGDYNSQQIPFYMYANQMIQNGTTNYSWVTDLGSSFVNSYSFYLLGSPFFWLTLVFDYKLIPYLMPFLLMLKFAFASLGAYIYLKRYSTNAIFTNIAALLYAFSGFSIYNVFFNHFLESVVFFPFLLWALDEFMYKGKKGFFAFFVAINLLNNYFFFVGQVIFLIIYFVCKVVSNDYILDIKKFKTLAFESILGFFMGCALLIPSIPNLLTNPRTSYSLENFGIWMYNEVQQYFAIFFSAILPPDPPYTASIFLDANIKWTSMSMFVALGGLFGYFLFLKHNKKSAFFKVFSVCLLFAFVPILNSSFYAFNSSYYARWYYMPLLMLSAMNMQGFSYPKQDIKNAIKPVFYLLLVPVLFAITPTKNQDGELFFGLADEMALFLLNILIGFLSVYLVYIIVSNHHSKEKYHLKLLYACLFMIFVLGISHFSLTKMPQLYTNNLFKLQNYDSISTFDLDLYDDNQDFRIDNYQCFDNFGLYSSYPSIYFFNSTVDSSIMHFYPNVGVTRNVNSNPSQSLYALRSLLSVRYLITPDWETENLKSEFAIPIYEYHSQQYPYTIFENEYFIPFGFTYDKYVTYDDLSIVNEDKRANILLRAIALDEEILKEYNLPLTRLNEDSLYDYSFESFEIDVENRKNSSSYSFEMNDDGFIANINLEKENLVFFSVPYSEGFTAYINGEKAEILKANYALSAVYAPMGELEIVFEYKTPYLDLGVFISFTASIIYIAYLYYIKRKGN